MNSRAALTRFAQEKGINEILTSETGTPEFFLFLLKTDSRGSPFTPSSQGQGLQCWKEGPEQ